MLADLAQLITTSRLLAVVVVVQEPLEAQELPVKAAQAEKDVLVRLVEH